MVLDVQIKTSCLEGVSAALSLTVAHRDKGSEGKLRNVIRWKYRKETLLQNGPRNRQWGRRWFCSVVGSQRWSQVFFGVPTEAKCSLYLFCLSFFFLFLLLIQLCLVLLPCLCNVAYYRLSKMLTGIHRRESGNKVKG